MSVCVNEVLSGTLYTRCATTRDSYQSGHQGARAHYYKVTHTDLCSHTCFFTLGVFAVHIGLLTLSLCHSEKGGLTEVVCEFPGSRLVICMGLELHLGPPSSLLYIEAKTLNIGYTLYATVSKETTLRTHVYRCK